MEKKNRKPLIDAIVSGIVFIMNKTDQKATERIKENIHSSVKQLVKKFVKHYTPDTNSENKKSVSKDKKKLEINKSELVKTLPLKGSQVKKTKKPSKKINKSNPSK